MWHALDFADRGKVAVLIAVCHRPGAGAPLTRTEVLLKPPLLQPPLPFTSASMRRKGYFLFGVSVLLGNFTWAYNWMLLEDAVFEIILNI